jgi:hypothetical protein
LDTVIVPNPLDFVNAKNSAVVPVPTLKVADVAPAADVTGLSVVERLEMINAFCEVTETEVPATIPLIENLSASAASTWLSEGTLTVAGDAGTFAVVMLTPFTVNAIMGFAKADGLTKKVEPIPRLSTMAVIFFLNIMPHS